MPRATPAFTLDARLRGKARRLLILYADQLDRDAPALTDLDPDRDAVLMMETDAASTSPPSHAQRTALFLAAMRHFAQDLADKDLRVRYVRLDDKDNTHDFQSEIERACADLEPEQLHLTRPGSWAALRAAQRAAKASKIGLTLHEDEHFLTPLDTFDDWAEGRKELTMEYFYREQRKRLAVLVDDDGKPEGGRWNLDKDNRESFAKEPDTPRPRQCRPDDVTREVMDLVADRLDLPGAADTLRWPVTRAEARKALRDFIDNRLPDFGTYEDAMWSGEHALYHALLSPALNLKLLSPRECVDAAVEAYHRGDAPLNSVEGFVRQLIGWREFIRCVYWREGEDYASRNTLGQTGDLPEFYWTADTDMACLRDTVSRVLDHAYTHHIERLMVLGNFALIAGVEPAQINDWFLGMYADGVEWATTPNVIGMSMHADGGVVGTKPYAASANYINKMSNFCAPCPYDHRSRTGDDACPFNTLYWDFLIRNRKRFDDNQRMKLILKNVDRMNKDERAEITVAGRRLRDRLGIESEDA